jgi:uncharacterized integral membrane protein
MSTPPRRRVTLTPKQAGGLVLVAVAVVFGVENTGRTKIRFIVPQLTAPLWLALLVPFLLGFGAGALIVHRRR